MNITAEKLQEFANGLDAARAAVFVCAQALDGGETDLELQSAKILSEASDKIDEVYDELISMGVAARLCKRSSKRVQAVMDALIGPRGTSE
jgi:hypothetical protein